MLCANFGSYTWLTKTARRQGPLLFYYLFVLT